MRDPPARSKTGKYVRSWKRDEDGSISERKFFLRCTGIFINLLPLFWKVLIEKGRISQRISNRTWIANLGRYVNFLSFLQNSLNHPLSRTISKPHRFLKRPINNHHSLPELNIRHGMQLISAICPAHACYSGFISCKARTSHYTTYNDGGGALILQVNFGGINPR